MKTDVTTYGSLLQSQKRLPGTEAKAAARSGTPKVIDPNLLQNKSSPDYKLDISKPEASNLPPLPSLPSAPSAPSVSKPEIKKPDVKKLEDVAEVKEASGTLKKPVIIFVKGLDIFSSPSTSEGGYAGVGKMADAVKGSRIYGWDQHEEIIKEIKKVEVNQPVVLVGHSFGGDTAVEIADELDSLEHGFRKVDLLVTIDAVGFDHDIIPQNVKKHLNVFGETSMFLNDGPHVARRHEMTEVKNILSPLDHTEIDDDKGIQFEIMNMIQDTLKKSV